MLSRWSWASNCCSSVRSLSAEAAEKPRRGGLDGCAKTTTDENARRNASVRIMSADSTMCHPERSEGLAGGAARHTPGQVPCYASNDTSLIRLRHLLPAFAGRRALD